MIPHLILLRLATAVVFAAITVSCANSGNVQTAPQADIIIRGATLIDGTGAPPQPNTTVIIRDGLIEAVTTDSAAEAATAARIIDAAGKYVIPGLADMHVHFSMGAPIPRGPGTTEEVLARELYYGVTSILNLGATEGGTAAIRSLQQRRSTGSLQAPYIYGTGGHVQLQGSHPVYTIFPPAIRKAADALAATVPLSDPVNLYSLGLGISLVRTEQAAQKAVRERAEGGMVAIKIIVESGPTPFGNDHPLMSVEMIRAIVDAANQHDLPVFAHVSSREELEAALEGGAAGAAHAPQDVPLPDANLAERMAAAGFVMMPTLSLFVAPDHLDDPFLRATASDDEIKALLLPEFIDQVRARWECCAGSKKLLANVAMMHDHGVPIVLGTDTGNPYVFPGYSVHRELELLVRSGLAPMEALKAATIHAAEMIGAEDEFGTIEPAKRADLLILGANPLQDITNTRSLEIVIHQGQVLDREKLIRRFQ